MSISTYFRPNIHQNGPGILEVKDCGQLLFGLQKHIQQPRAYFEYLP
jgi:hypothetical protein